jgi:RNA polymerase sigma-70 factor (ECF subfamily)
LSECPDLAAAVRTATLPHLRTEAKTALQRIRERLSSEERALLVLRVDRALPWEEVARALLGEDEISDASRLRRATQSVRQQYRRLKEKLAVMLRAEGLWADSSRPAEEANEP